MLLPFFSIDYYLLSMGEDIQEIFKESSVNNSLKSVPNDSCTFSGKRQKMECVYIGHLNYTTKSLPKITPMHVFH